MDIETKKRRHPNNTCNCKCHTCNCCTRNTEDEGKRNCKQIPISNFESTVYQDEGSNQKGQDFQQQEAFSLNPTKKEVEKIQVGSQSIDFLRGLKEKILEKCNFQNKDDSFEEIIQANIQKKDEIKVQLSENDMMDQIQEISEEDIKQKIKENIMTDFLGAFKKLRIQLRNITNLKEETNPITSKIEEKMEIILKNITNFILAAYLESQKESDTQAKRIFYFDLFNFEAGNFGRLYRNQMILLFQKPCFSDKDLVQKFLIADFEVYLILQDREPTLQWLRQVFENNDEMKKQITSIGEEVLKLGFKIDS